MKTTSLEDKLNSVAIWLIATILVLLPFHAFFTTWLGSNFGHLDLFRIWKELLMIPLAVYALVILWCDKGLARRMASSWLVRLSLLYIGFFLIFGLVARSSGSANDSALLYSWITNLRLVGFMLIVWIISSKNQLIIRNWLRIVLAPAAVVVVFGLVQRLCLPADFLRHFGYGPNTIPAVQTVDQKLAFRRIQSTLRGSNPLGAYLVVALAALIAGWRRYWLFILATAGALFLTYSRSAWLGAAVVVALLVWYYLPRHLRKLALLVVAVAVLAGGGAVWGLRHNDAVQNTFFHSDEKSRSSVSSNAARSSAMVNGLRNVWHQPFGQGPGTAGPASVRNNHPARIAENYYIQIAQEVGIVGLSLFVAINVLVAKALWQRRSSPLALALLASLVGITLVNMLSHAWSDDTLSLLWWGLAGAAMCLPSAIMNKQQTKAAVKR